MLSPAQGIPSCKVIHSDLKLPPAPGSTSAVGSAGLLSMERCWQHRGDMCLLGLGEESELLRLTAASLLLVPRCLLLFEQVAPSCCPHLGFCQVHSYC